LCRIVKAVPQTAGPQIPPDGTYSKWSDLFPPDYALHQRSTKFQTTTRIEKLNGLESYLMRRASPDGWAKPSTNTGKGVLLSDEIEKAHRRIWDLFLRMLDIKGEAFDLESPSLPLNFGEKH
jgi:hypothetical protein